MLSFRIRGRSIKCHKEVWALKIKEVSVHREGDIVKYQIVPEDFNYHTFDARACGAQHQLRPDIGAGGTRPSR
jgi:hypothetical protein